MRFFLLVTIAFLATLSSFAQSVKNPVWNDNFPDPTSWKASDGKYYAVATGVSKLLTSADLKHWEDTGIKPVGKDDIEKMRATASNFWAPDVTEMSGQRLMYLTLYNSAEDSNIAVLRETSRGQFSFSGILTRGSLTGIEDTIDPEVITDGETGKVWMFFGSVGGIHRIELTPDGMSVKPGSTYVHVAGLRVKEDATRQHVFEGSYLHRHGGYWYLFVSCGNFWDHTYSLLVGRSRTLEGVFRDRQGREMAKGFATPVLTSSEGDFFYGPGHCGEIHEGPDGKEYILYHCHTKDLKPGQRAMLADEILWDKEGWPYCEGGKPSINLD